MANPASSSQSPTTISLQSLLCHEAEPSCLEFVTEDDPLLHLPDYRNPTDADDDYIRIQLQRETMIGSVKAPPSKIDSLSSTTADADWTKQARLDAVDYILHTSVQLGFHYQTAYLSILYVDKFLWKRRVDIGKLWAVQLLSVACLSLAAKLEECRVPSLPEFQVGKFCFESRIVRRMELLVLETLKWKMCSVTAFAYLPYFIDRFADHHQPPSKAILPRAIHHILAMARGINSVEHHQSVIASVAVLAAMDQRLPRKALESKMHAVPLGGFIDIEDVITCYSSMQQLELDNISMSKLLASPQVSSSSHAAQTMKSSANYPVGLKRKRLTSDDTGQIIGFPDNRTYN